MKKAISLMLAIVLSLVFTVCASAADASVTARSSVTTAKVGDRITVTVTLSGSDSAKALGVSLDYSNHFKLVSGEFVKSGSLLAKFDTSTEKGAQSFESATDLNGDVFKAVLEVVGSATVNQNISVELIVRNGTTILCQKTASVSVKLKCSSHSFGSWTVSKEAKCEAKGEQTRVCSKCGETETQETNALGHSWGSWSVSKAAKCGEKGEEKRTCSGCSKSETREIAALEHSWGSWGTTQAATCTEKGTQKRTCSLCQGAETQPINALGHSMGSWSQTKAPNCTDKGEEKRSCTRNCGHSETRSINALGHSFSNPVVTKKPTCTETGTETGTCSRCSKTTSNTIKAAGHSYGKWKTVTEATCTEKGEKKRTCSSCSVAETKSIKALGHDFENPVMTKEPTISSTGLMEGKCKTCSETTKEIVPCKEINAATGIIVEADEGVFAEGTETNFCIITEDNANYRAVSSAVADKGGNFTAYGVYYTKDEKDVAPSGEYTLLMPGKVGDKAESLLLVHIADDGTVSEMNFEITDDGYISVVASKSGTYAIVNTADSSADGTESAPASSDNSVMSSVNDEKATGGMIWIFIVIACVVAAGVVIAILVIKKRKTE